MLPQRHFQPPLVRAAMSGKEMSKKAAVPKFASGLLKPKPHPMAKHTATIRPQTTHPCHEIGKPDP